MTTIATSGGRASAAWLDARGLHATREPHWYVEIVLGTEVADTVLDLNIYPEEWGFVVRHSARVSSIRVTDIPFVHGNDDFGLLPVTPPLEQFGRLLEALERRFDVTFYAMRAGVKTNLVRATGIVRAWLSGRVRDD